MKMLPWIFIGLMYFSLFELFVLESGGPLSIIGPKKTTIRIILLYISRFIAGVTIIGGSLIGLWFALTGRG
jgi:hypothetical protein